MKTKGSHSLLRCRIDMQRASTTEQLAIRGLRYNVRHWGPAQAPTVFLLHGWMDSSPTFQFVVDALRQDWHLIAPDWRGYGKSEWLGRPYWAADYQADLNALLAHYSPQRPARIVAHSMGANIAGFYAGVRPARVAQLAMLDFLGLKSIPDADAATRMDAWLAATAAAPRLRSYRDHAALARRLQAANPRLSAERAAFLARTVSRTRADGQLEMACDPWHRVAAPGVYRVEESMACWSRITAPVLMLIADEGYVQQRFGTDPAEYRRRLGCFARCEVVTITGSGHNVQHDQPEQVAAALERFLARD